MHDAGINWTGIEYISTSQVNWLSVGELAGAESNWNNLAKYHRPGSTGTISGDGRRGINWNDLMV